MMKSPVIEDLARNLNKSVGIALEQIMLNHNWSQKELAKRIDKDEAYVSKLLRGQHNLTVRTCAEIQSHLEEPIMEGLVATLKAFCERPAAATGLTLAEFLLKHSIDKSTISVDIMESQAYIYAA